MTINQVVNHRGSTSPSRGRIMRLVAGLIAASVSAVALADLPAIPVYLKEAVPPNLIFTFDVSGSMSWAYVPDAVGNDGAGRQNRHFLASPDTNPLAYNPAVSYPIPRKADGTFFSNTFTVARRNGLLPEITNARVTAGGTTTSTTNVIDLSSNYRVTIESEFQSQVLETVQARTARSAYYARLKKVPAATCPTILNTLDACYDIVTVGATSGPGATDERQNFANWYSFWRTRALAAKSGLMIALFDLDPVTRVTWQSFYDQCPLRAGSAASGNACKHPYTGAIYNNQLAEFNLAKRTVFFDWLRQAESSNSTPLRDAFKNVNNYVQTGITSPGNINNPWGATPGTTVAPVNACRTSYHVAVTDGLWNSDSGLAGTPDKDNQSFVLPDGRAYNPAAPFQGAFGPSLADLAFIGWATDASTAANKVWPYASTGLPADPATWAAGDYWNPVNDPANWQHVNTYAVGIGLSGFLTNAPAWGGETFSGSGYAGVANGTIQWPDPMIIDSNRVHDLWHAAINGRGDFYSADNPSDVRKAFQDIFGRIAGRSGTAGGISANTTWVATDTALFTSTYSTGDWTGTIGRTPINPDGSFGTATSTDAQFAPPVGSDVIPLDASARQIFTKNLNPTGSEVSVVPFKWANLSAASRSAITNSTSDADLVNYLRGDRSFERGNPLCEGSGTCKYRKRKKLLGDMLGSSPVLIANQDYGYRSETWTGAKAYQSYLKNKASAQHIVLVGANDGMVHAFSADAALNEVFAYVPSLVHAKLWRLKEDPYVKTSYVDGQIGVGDFYDGSWRTIAVGGLGAGGRGIYALDVSPGVAAASRPMWEFFDADMGQVTTRPIVQRLKNGEWVVLVPGGYDSPNGKSILYVLRARDGSLLQKIEFSNTTDACGNDRTASPNNGLGALSAVTTKDKRLKVFAGDLYGRLWQLSSTGSSSQLAVDLGGAPLLRACNGNNIAQPITTAPSSFSVGVAPMVFVGTGRLLKTGDMANTDVQSLYGVIADDTTPASNSRSTMYGQRTVTTVGNARTVSTNAINMVDKRGWFIDLPAAGERIVASPTIFEGRVAFTTFVPDNDACITGGSSWIFNLNGLDGAPPLTALLDVNGDGNLSAADKVGGAYASAVSTDATISSLAMFKLDTRPKPTSPGINLGGGTGGTSGENTACKRGQAVMAAPKLYVQGMIKGCTPQDTVRSGWRQLR